MGLGGRLKSWKGSQKETWLLEPMHKIVPDAFPITDRPSAHSSTYSLTRSH